jgi:hypothetical protein
MTLVMRKDYINNKESASTQIIYHCSTLADSILGIVIYIFTIGKVWHGQILITYSIFGETNHNHDPTHNRGKS